MNILDHRILIAQSAETIWTYISEFSNNPTWQVDVSNTSFLTSRHTGVGVRWRYTTPNGREYVAETTAWYEGLGYEYTFIDGAPYRESKGRLRLQEIAEGTIVQWTFSYEVGGLLGGMRNAVVLKRQIEGAMVDSLKMLWRVVNQQGKGQEREVKSLMRDAPDYEARAQYKPRHPSKSELTAQQEADVPTTITEPAFSDEDTRPRPPVVTAQAEADDGLPTDTPSPAEEVIIETLQPDTTENILPVDKRATTEATRIISSSETVDDELETAFSDNLEALPGLVMPMSTLPEQPLIVEITQDEPTPPTLEMPASETENLNPPSPTTTDSTETVSVEPSPLERMKMDTAEISIFEVFGIPKPSETQEMHTVVQSQPEAELVPPVVISSGGFGLRRGFRRRLVKLRIRVQ